jgi:hypothetical protein
MSSGLQTFTDNTLRAVFAPAPRGPKTADCPDAERFYELAAGLASCEAESRLIDHALECPRCGLIMKCAYEDLRTEPARTVLTMPARYRTLCIAAGIVVGVLCLAPFVWSRFALQHAQTLTARAEAASRPNEFRLSGAPFAPTGFTRSGANQDDVPAALLSADAWAGHASASPEAELLRARIAFDSRQTNGVARGIQDVIARTGRTPALLNDLGAAQAAHGIATRNEAEVRQALATLSEAQALPEARFNRALVLNYLGDTAAACRIPADPDPRWRIDLQSRLNCK